MTRDRFTSDLVAWLNRRVAPPGVVIAADTPLFTSGLINSLRILELIAWTELALGLTIPDVMIRTDNFASARRMAEVFLPEVQHVDG